MPDFLCSRQLVLQILSICTYHSCLKKGANLAKTDGRRRFVEEKPGEAKLSLHIQTDRLLSLICFIESKSDNNSPPVLPPPFLFPGLGSSAPCSVLSPYLSTTDSPLPYYVKVPIPPSDLDCMIFAKRESQVGWDGVEMDLEQNLWED